MVRVGKTGRRSPEAVEYPLCLRPVVDVDHID